jgi:hypothetical protein
MEAKTKIKKHQPRGGIWILSFRTTSLTIQKRMVDPINISFSAIENGITNTVIKNVLKINLSSQGSRIIED